MTIPVPTIHIIDTNTVGLRRYRIKEFKITADWSEGDLLLIDDIPSIFIRVLFIERETGRQTNNWLLDANFVIVADHTGFKEIPASVFYNRKLQIITKFNDIS